MILATCRTVRDEAEDLVSRRGRKLVMNAPPRIIVNSASLRNRMRSINLLCTFIDAITLQTEFLVLHGLHAGISPGVEGVSNLTSRFSHFNQHGI